MAGRKKHRRKERTSPQAAPKQPRPGTTPPVRREHPKLSRRRLWAYRLVAMTLVPAVFFVLVELGLRVLGVGYPAHFFVRLPGHDVLTTNQQFGWRFFPPAIARTPAVDELPATKGAKEYRIFVLGGSAAMGTPDDAFGFGRWLEAMLRERYPGVDFHVFNAAMTAINSHVVLPIARDCASQSPDAFVVYMGNNEVVGPYGAGTVFHGYTPRLSMIRASVFARTTRIGQMIGGLAGREDVDTEWKGMEMFLGQQVAADDPRLEKVYDHFRDNLEDICRVTRDSGARVVVCTVATNLKDCAPFAAAHRSNLTEADRVAWDALYTAGKASAAAGDFSEARDRFLEAVEIDDRHANLHYRLAHCLAELAEHEKAREHYVLARDLDTQRFRADTRINEIIRQVAGERDKEGVALLDVEQALAQNPSTPHGILGEELFYEHVHLTPDGNYQLAKLVFEQLESTLPGWISDQATGKQDTDKQDLNKTSAPSMETCRRRMPLTDFDRYQMLLSIADMTEKPPFTNQIDYEEQRDARRREAADMGAEATTPEALDEAAQWYAEAIEQHSEDVETRRHYAQLLLERKDYDDAVAQWQVLLRRYPDRATWRLEFGSVLLAQGKFPEAVDEYREAMRTNPWIAGTAHYRIGLVFVQQQKYDEAVEEFRLALTLGPETPRIHNNLGVALLQQGKTKEATASFRRTLKLADDHAGAYNNLGIILERQKDLVGAEKHFREALRCEPANLDATHNLAALLVKQGKPDEAIEQYRKAIALAPNRANLHFRLARLLASRKQTAEAVDEYRRVVEIDPGHLDARCQLAGGLLLLGHAEEAIEQYREVLRRRPDWLPAMNALGLVHATLADPQFRNAAEAIRLLEQACAQTGNRDPVILDSMAAAYAAADRFDDAVATATKALRLAEIQGNQRLAITLQERINLYRQGQALNGS